MSRRWIHARAYFAIGLWQQNDDAFKRLISDVNILDFNVWKRSNAVVVIAWDMEIVRVEIRCVMWV